MATVNALLVPVRPEASAAVKVTPLAPRLIVTPPVHTPLVNVPVAAGVMGSGAPLAAALRFTAPLNSGSVLLEAFCARMVTLKGVPLVGALMPEKEKW